ncbi:DUF6236 family protein [Streptomyces virginiae]|uniref:DUF6236 family protein n=1 Tax=Streptomyces virginiae TaxID=1961 RepID=A0ABZ1T6Q3_STRVG|nr:DUF6236 family protein [Streptomyces virginiae]
MPLQTGLDSSYVRLRDESWAKAAALNGRNVARVVPPGFPVQDREVVGELNQDSGFLVDPDPRPAAEAVASAFFTAVQNNADALRARFAVRDAGSPRAGSRPRALPRPAGT